MKEEIEAELVKRFGKNASQNNSLRHINSPLIVEIICLKQDLVVAESSERILWTYGKKVESPE